MERLTFEGNFCDIAQCRELPCKHDGECAGKRVWERLKEYENTIWTPEMLRKLNGNAAKMWGFAQAVDNMTIERLKELTDADKDGRVVVLPCAPDAIYWERSGSILAQARFEGLHVYEDGTIKYAGYGMEICAEDIGKIVFLSREEAEKALQEMDGKNDGNETSM